jgi:maltooligosyltrehalose trehalohydrolase
MIAKRTIGLNFISENTADLQVWAPLASMVKISINNEVVKSLHKEEHGFWELDALRIHPGDRYQLIVDDIVLTDPVSLFQPDGVHSPSAAFNLNHFKWTDKHWPGIPPQELIIYELHTGTFTEEGTFDAIIPHLDYLKELGITAIELMPVAQFPGDRNWGYDGVYPFAVQHSYGGPERLQHLVDVCHKKGLAVILDVVYNHLGPEGNYLPAFGPVFTDKYKTPWGQAINFDDEWSDGIRKIVIENVLMWFRDFHIDGLRLDAIHAIKDFSAQHILQEIKHHVSELNILSSKNHFLIGESDLNDIKVISPFEKGGYNLDATWCDEFHHSIHALVTGEKNGYYSDFGKIEQIAKTLNDAYVYDGIWTEHRKRKFGNKTTGLPGHKFVVFTQNHDQVGNRMMGDRLSTNISFELLKQVAGTMLLSPFIPMLFMGEEYAETNPFLYFTSHSDHDLIRAVREGRKNEFKAFMSEGEAPDPQAIETFRHSKLNWNKRTEKQAFILNFYKELIHLRKTLPALRNTDRQGVSAEVFKNKNAIILTRKSPEQQLVAVLNFEPSEINIEKEVKGFHLLLNSADAKWGGSIQSVNKTTPPQSVTLWLKS